MFMVKDHDYFIEPVPDYLHNVHTVDTDYKKPHIIYRRSIEETKMFHETPSETFNRLWYRDRRSCGTQRKLDNHCLIAFVLFFGVGG